MTDRSYLLLVEDNPGDARLTQALLDDLAGNGLPPLRWVQTADAAVELLRNEPHCRAVLLDLGLPDSQGLQSLHAVADANGHLPIIVLTGDHSAPMGLDAVASGAQDFLVKGSFDAAMLQRSIAFASQRKRKEVELVQRSLHDDLTGLPRRTLLLDRLQGAMKRAARSGGSGAVLFIDLDRFKQVNDQHGHAAGDAVLVAIAKRLEETIRSSDTIARMGGDEFVVLLPVTSGAQDAVAVGEKLLKVIAEPIPFAGRELLVGASIGVACFSGDATEHAEKLIQRADSAMYSAKAAGKGRVSML